MVDYKVKINYKHLGGDIMDSKEVKNNYTVLGLIYVELQVLIDCSEYAFGGEDGGEWKIKCHRCRDICPHCYGKININMKRKKMS